MRKLYLSVLGAIMAGCVSMSAETINLEGKDYQFNRMIDREIGPGIRHLRLRAPSYPLNVNLLMVDLTNPYNRIETTTANESAKGTESLVSAANRQSSAGHRAVAGANANFWIVATQAEEAVYLGTTRNANVRNGKMVTESNQNQDQWDGGTNRTGVVSVSYDKTLYIDRCTSDIKVTAASIGSLTVHQCNKGIHPRELCMYNSFYGKTRAFMPITDDWKPDVVGDATEVLLDMLPGEEWTGGNPIRFKVAEVRTSAGGGTLGNHDLALVGRGDNAPAIAALKEGEEVTLQYTWTYRHKSDNPITPIVEQAIGGNALVMIDGELTNYNTNETYNSQVYSRTGYGCSKDGKTLYVIVIDKSTDPTYGSSAGCNTTKMCEIAKHYGCSYMANFDAGGSAEMLINGKIENRTTEGNPRAVANGWLVYCTAPEDDDTVGRLAFDEVDDLVAPIYGSYTPRVIAYDKNGRVLDYDFKDYTISCSDGLGTCSGNVFTASGTPGKGTVTVSCGDATATRDLEVLQAQIACRIPNLLIDGTREYSIEVEAEINGNTYTYDPANINWVVDNPEVVEVNADGILKGLSEGKAVVTGKVGEFECTCNVTVEISTEQQHDWGQWDQWTAKGSSGLTNVSLGADGKVTYTYGSPRDAYIQMTRAIDFYSLPEQIFVEFTSSLPINNIVADLRAPQHTRVNSVKITPASSFAAGEHHTVELPISELGNAEDLAIYPISLKYLRFTSDRSTDYKGAQNFHLHRVYATYKNIPTGVENVATPSATGRHDFLRPNPVTAGGTVMIDAADIASVEVYTLGGASVLRVAGADSFTAPAVAGAYAVRAICADGTVISSIMIVK